MLYYVMQVIGLLGVIGIEIILGRYYIFGIYLYSGDFYNVFNEQERFFPTSIWIIMISSAVKLAVTSKTIIYKREKDAYYYRVWSHFRKITIFIRTIIDLCSQVGLIIGTSMFMKFNPKWYDEQTLAVQSFVNYRDMYRLVFWYCVALLAATVFALMAQIFLIRRFLPVIRQLNSQSLKPRCDWKNAHELIQRIRILVLCFLILLVSIDFWEIIEKEEYENDDHQRRLSIFYIALLASATLILVILWSHPRRTRFRCDLKKNFIFKFLIFIFSNCDGFTVLATFIYLWVESMLFQESLNQVQKYEEDEDLCREEFTSCRTMYLKLYLEFFLAIASGFMCIQIFFLLGDIFQQFFCRNPQEQKNKERLGPYITNRNLTPYLDESRIEIGSYVRSQKVELKQMTDKYGPLTQYNQASKIGSGSFGNVYKLDKGLQGKFAVKVQECSNEEFVLQMYTEYLWLNNLRYHRNVIKIYDCYFITVIKENGVKSQEVYQFMDLADFSLDQMIQKRMYNQQMIESYRTINNFKKIAMDLVQGLYYLFTRENSLTHYDIKPANILYLNGVYKVSDLGSAKINAPEQTYVDLQSLNASKFYMPPESKKDRGNNKIQTFPAKYDIYSLGLTLLQDFLSISHQKIIEANFQDPQQGKINLQNFLKQNIMEIRIRNILQRMLKNSPREGIGYEELIPLLQNL